MKAYINACAMISPQPTFAEDEFPRTLTEASDVVLRCQEPEYKQYINPMMLRRMPRILKMAMAAASKCVQSIPQPNPDAIVVGSGLASVNELDSFFASMIEQDEQELSPITFINSSHNAVAGQLAMMLKVHGYNTTHCHRGVSFENALLDSLLLLAESEATNVLVGGIDEHSPTSHALLEQHAMFRSHSTSNLNLLNAEGKGTIAGEGAGFFTLSNAPLSPKSACLHKVETWYADSSPFTLAEHIEHFMGQTEFSTNDITTVIKGVNGDAASDALYILPSSLQACEQLAYKHLCGEYATASAFAIYIALQRIGGAQLHPSCYLQHAVQRNDKQPLLLIVNHFRRQSYSLMLVGSAAS